MIGNSIGNRVKSQYSIITLRILIQFGHLFVAVMGCSNYTYAEITPTEQLPDWISAQVHTLEFLGGVPQVVVPDNTKAAVTSPCRYDPDINRTYQEGIGGTLWVCGNSRANKEAQG